MAWFKALATRAPMALTGSMTHIQSHDAQSPLLDALAALKAQEPILVRRTEEWSSINSGSLELPGLARMADVAADALSTLPGAVERITLGESERVRADGVIERRAHGCALQVQVRPAAPIQIALTGHYDTVFAAAHPFQAPTRLDARVLNGPGVADMKGGLVIMIAALAAFEGLHAAGAIGYTILLSPDEEIGSPASAPLLASLGARAHVGMTYEPAMPDGALAGARKGSGNYSLIIKGRAAHVGRAFADGRSAVVAAAQAVLRLNDLNGVRDGVTVNVGAVDGGAPVNMVPDGAVVRFNIRSPDGEGQAWGEDQARAIAAALDAQDGISAHLHGAITRPPKPMTGAQATLFGWLRESGALLGLDLEWRASGGVCEGNNLFAAGCPNIDTLGVRGANLHSDQEYALMDSFAERAQLSLVLLHAFACGQYDPRSLRG
jgi:glutamate carboxypeptidase